jgi:ferredoxin
VNNPDECIDCSVCVTECPVNAICQDKDLPADQQQFLELNRRLSLIWPPASAASPPLPDREQWRDVPMKRRLLPPDSPAEPQPVAAPTTIESTHGGSIERAN